MGNGTWACFDCREAMRRPTHFRAAVPCPACGRPGRSLGTKIRIPPRDRIRSWQDLRLALRAQAAAAAETLARIRVERRHRLEREIAELSRRPPTQARRRAITLLRTRLAAT